MKRFYKRAKGCDRTAHCDGRSSNRKEHKIHRTHFAETMDCYYIDMNYVNGLRLIHKKELAKMTGILSEKKNRESFTKKNLFFNF